MLRTVFAFLLLALVLRLGGLSCNKQFFSNSTSANKGRNEDDAEVLTNFGKQGNEYLIKQYREYSANRDKGNLKGCSPSGEKGRRLLLTGFGRMVAQRQNLSGLVVGSMMDARFWKNEESIDLALKRSFSGSMGDEDVPSASGARVLQRSLTYNGKKYEVCLLTMVVQWDLAAAIILYESKRFAPDMIIMTGRGAQSAVTTLEYSAVNETRKTAGATYRGEAMVQTNLPAEDRILAPGPDVVGPVIMTWDNQALATKVSRAVDLVNKLGWKDSKPFSLNAMKTASPHNNYICNNTSFVVLHGLRGVPVPLAGGLLTLQIPALPHTKAGFLHFGAPETGASSQALVYSLGHILMSLAEAQLGLMGQ